VLSPHAGAIPESDRLFGRRHTLGEFLQQFPSITREMAVAAIEEAKESLLARIA
jgi:hypothetical protein